VVRLVEKRLVGKSVATLIPFTLVFAAICFNFVLCFINTNIIGITPLSVMLAELMIISFAFLASLRFLNQTYVILIIATVGYTLTLSLIRLNVSPERGFDIKIVRDFLIPIAFFMLGLTVKNLRHVDVAIKWISTITLSFAAFEYFYLTTFLKYFDVLKYYLARGTIAGSDSSHAFLVAGGLYFSGIRPEAQGRSLFPFLGEHRISSIFLEPISLGYFGIIIVLWGLVRSRIDAKIHFFPLLAGLLCIVLSDSRFGASVIIVATIVTFMPAPVSQIGVLFIPLFLVFGLLLLPEFFNLSTDLGLGGRLSYSARVLTNFDAWNWLGFKASHLQTFDSGYAYVFSGIGIVGFAVFWVVFLSIKGRSIYFNVFRNLSAAYFAIALCIGEGQLTIKTASLLWFMMGALAITWIPAPRKERARLARNQAVFPLSGAHQPLRVDGY
jgi:putative polymerase